MKTKSIEELKLLADENNSYALYELGDRFFKGDNVEKDYEMAKAYFEKAEKLGNTKGKYGIAKCYYYGRGVEQNYEKAYNMFYELMTTYKDNEAKYYIGLMYYNGKYMKQNFEMAYNIFNELAENDDVFAKSIIADMYYYGDYVKKNRKKAFSIHSELYEKENHISSLYTLIYLYYYGNGTKKNYKKARQYGELYFEKYQNDCDIAYLLGKIYFYGKKVRKDYKKAEFYFTKSLNEKYNNSYYYLAEIYKTGGYGIKRDIERSKEFLFKVEKDFLKSIFYYNLGIGKESFEDLIKSLDFSKKLLDEQISYCPTSHPAVTNYNKLSCLTKKQQKELTINLKGKLTKFYNQYPKYISFDTVDNEEQVDILAEVIINSKEYETIEQYIKDNKDNNRIVYMVGVAKCMGKECDKDIKEGLELLNEVANKGYDYARYKLAEIYYEGTKVEENHSKALHYLENISNINDTNLIEMKNTLIKKICYGSNNEKKSF